METKSKIHFSAEWQPHVRTWMAWPCRLETWEDNLSATKRNYALVANTIAQFEPVTMLANLADVKEARTLLSKAVQVLPMSIDDSWTRDTGPIFIKKDGEVMGCDFRFNAWGNKYEKYNEDAKMAQRILAKMDYPRIDSHLIMEGGGITTDGEGTAIITESCFLNKNRNPHWTKKDIEKELHRTLGIEKVLWIPGDADETETDGHVDLLTVFIRSGVVIMEQAKTPDHPRNAVFQQNKAAIEGQLDAKERPIQIEWITMPDAPPKMNDTFALSYINCYFVNGGILLPAFGVPSDVAAKQRFVELFPDRKVVQIPVNDIAVGGGSIHCITCQQPVLE
ncbi:MAG: agmatine deiminase family protein [Bacteroidota bacterium]